jgi:3-isopropylmalate/(R)-2-methylmalate dehydratase small subunit
MTEPLRRLEATMAALPMANIDTDQIIPARFLKVIDRRGLGDALFADWRYRADGAPDPVFPLNRTAAHGVGILVAGDNFGCGSSREHAPWALLGFGIRAVISTSFADIFRNNALGNGLLPVQVDASVHARLLALCTAAPAPRAIIDVEHCTITYGEGEIATFPLEPFARHCLLHGVDRLGFLLSCGDAIDDYEQRHDQRTGVPA